MIPARTDRHLLTRASSPHFLNMIHQSSDLSGLLRPLLQISLRVPELNVPAIKIFVKAMPRTTQHDLLLSRGRYSAIVGLCE
jgi:hypothetical protein